MAGMWAGSRSCYAYLVGDITKPQGVTEKAKIGSSQYEADKRRLTHLLSADM